MFSLKAQYSPIFWLRVSLTSTWMAKLPLPTEVASRPRLADPGMILPSSSGTPTALQKTSRNWRTFYMEFRTFMAPRSLLNFRKYLLVLGSINRYSQHLRLLWQKLDSDELMVSFEIVYSFGFSYYRVHVQPVRYDHCFQIVPILRHTTAATT